MLACILGCYFTPFYLTKVSMVSGTIVTKWLFDQCTAERSYLIKIQDIYKKTSNLILVGIIGW